MADRVACIYNCRIDGFHVKYGQKQYERDVSEAATADYVNCERIIRMADLQNFETKIDDYISYLPACEEPLSSQVGVVRCGDTTYFYDVGCLPGHIEFINSTPGRKVVVLSHFHEDHVWNIGSIECDAVYGGEYTIKHILKNDRSKDAIIPPPPFSKQEICHSVSGPVHFDGAIPIDIVTMPSSHSKGSVALIVNNEYAFVGDATYCMTRHKKAMYNVQQLKAEIDFLEMLPCSKLILSHDRRYVRPRALIIRELKAFYSTRCKLSPYVILGDESE